MHNCPEYLVELSLKSKELTPEQFVRSGGRLSNNYDYHISDLNKYHKELHSAVCDFSYWCTEVKKLHRVSEPVWAIADVFRSDDVIIHKDLEEPKQGYKHGWRTAVQDTKNGLEFRFVVYDTMPSREIRLTNYTCFSSYEVEFLFGVVQEVIRERENKYRKEARERLLNIYCKD